MIHRDLVPSLQTITDPCDLTVTLPQKLPTIFEANKMADQTGSIKLAIHHNDQGKGTLYRLKKNSMVHVHPGPSLLGRRVAIFCNYPADGK